MSLSVIPLPLIDPKYLTKMKIKLYFSNLWRLREVDENAERVLRDAAQNQTGPVWDTGPRWDQTNVGDGAPALGWHHVPRIDGKWKTKTRWYHGSSTGKIKFCQISFQVSNFGHFSLIICHFCRYFAIFNRHCVFSTISSSCFMSIFATIAKITNFWIFY